MKIFIFIIFTSLLQSQDCNKWQGNNDTYKGLQRRIAKTTALDIPLSKSFNNILELKSTLIPDKEAKKIIPKKRDACDYDRFDIEKRNVEVKNVYIFFYKYENSAEGDNDFHLIVGNDTNNKETLFNMEISALTLEPQTENYKALSKVRNQWKQLIDTAQVVKSYSYYKFVYPIKVNIYGSLFFDTDHNAGVVGPGKNKPTSAWEIHPVIDFEVVR
ncbi:MAG: hypothetical protein NTW25_00490 [Candidatus Kapabacteria bacterium]|nr:hypothetical protein [Candidatus Kapabacteria bacterium]